MPTIVIDFVKTFVPVDPTVRRSQINVSGFAGAMKPLYMLEKE